MDIKPYVIVAVSSIFMIAQLCSQEEKSAKEKYETAIFAGGSFWCMQPAFDNVDGVISTVAGYTGGKKANPTYEEVSSGKSGHLEAVQVIYDPNVVSYPELLNVYWHNIDPTVKNRQFCDVGAQYRSVIFYQNDMPKQAAEKSKASLLSEGKFKKVETEILAAKEFYPAEEYHQMYYKKNPGRYKFYRYNCGRDQRLKQIWGESPETSESLSG